MKQWETSGYIAHRLCLYNPSQNCRVSTLLPTLNYHYWEGAWWKSEAQIVVTPTLIFSPAYIQVQREHIATTSTVPVSKRVTDKERDKPVSSSSASSRWSFFTVKWSQWAQPAPLRADRVCSAPRQITHKSCVSSGVINMLHGEHLLNLADMFDIPFFPNTHMLVTHAQHTNGFLNRSSWWRWFYRHDTQTASWRQRSWWCLDSFRQPFIDTTDIANKGLFQISWPVRGTETKFVWIVRWWR